MPATNLREWAQGQESAAQTCVVVPPQRSDFVLSSDVPDVKLDVLVCDRLDIEADCSLNRKIATQLG